MAPESRTELPLALPAGGSDLWAVLEVPTVDPSLLCGRG